MRQRRKQQFAVEPKSIDRILSRSCLVTYILVTLGIPAWVSIPVCAAGWPSLNAIEERQSNPVRVGEHMFMTGYYSWYVELHQVDNLRYGGTVNERLRSWSVIVGLGGDEPIGPRVFIDGKLSQNRPNRVSPHVKQNAASAQQLSKLPKVPPIPALSVPLPLLPQAPKLGPLAPMSSEELPALPALPSFSDTR